MAMVQDNKVSVSFFGVQRSVTGTDGITLEVSENMRVTDALALLKERFPGLELGPDMFVVTVNQEKAQADRLLKANDSISFLPFISGG